VWSVSVLMGKGYILAMTERRSKFTLIDNFKGKRASDVVMCHEFLFF